ncbi:MAG: FAD:protein FMN transferase [Clostridia bacterium]|nr:FAD:protein FMN transferase [Clostridia bacterium]
MRRFAAFALILCVIFAFAACAPVEETVAGFSMGSSFYVNYYGSSEIDREVRDLLDSIDRTYSATFDFSTVSKINSADAGDEILLSEAEIAVFRRIFEISEETDGAFDPSILPLVRAWGFDPPFSYNGKTPPSEDAIAAAKRVSELSHFYFNDNSRSIVKLEKDSALDFGAAIKGYAAQKLVELLKGKVDSALVNVGGTVGAVNADYPIGIQPPRDSDFEFVFSFTLNDGEVCATSGDYENYYLYNGARYHHILDAATGYPSKSGVIAASVISKDGLLSDALATAAVVLGKEGALSLFKKFGVRGAIITEEKEIYTFDLPIKIKDRSYVLLASESEE